MLVTYYFISLFFIAISARIYPIPQREKEKDPNYWFEDAQKDIDFAINRVFNTNRAKNVILFLGDGMGITVTTAGRIYKGQKLGKAGEEECLVWEKFPNVGLSKTYNLDKQVPDSAGTGTAYLTGVKANYYTIGLKNGIKRGDCKSSLLEENRASSVLKWSQEANKQTGFITTTRLTHATPANTYAHSADRYWECDKDLKSSENDTTGCKDIAQQLVEDLPGKNINVIFAGGRRQMGASEPEDKNGSSCLRTDGRNLVQEWLTSKTDLGKTAEYVKNTQEFRQLEDKDVDYMMGLFSGNHLPYNLHRDKSPEGTPALKDLVRVAIKRLKKSDEGFFLLVEGGRIDHALHDTKTHVALEELTSFEEAVEEALKFTNNEETLVIVTADHSHGMTMNGYPDRGNDILGLTYNKYVEDKLPYPTLMFSIGPGANYTWDGKKVTRNNLTNVDTRDPDFTTQAAIKVPMGHGTHGGEDVGIYATGPMSHLFHRVHEQSYIAHVMARASCVGPYKMSCPSSSQHRRDPEAEAVESKSSSSTQNVDLAVLTILIGSNLFF